MKKSAVAWTIRLPAISAFEHALALAEGAARLHALHVAEDCRLRPMAIQPGNVQDVH